MSTHQFKPGALALAIAAALLPASQAHAVEYWLKAVATSASMPNPDGGTASVVVPMWGYMRCTGFGAADTCDPASVPGPALTVPAGDTSLTVHLENNLPVPTSLVVNGLHKAMSPAFTTDAEKRRRVRSFDTEIAAGARDDYTWTNVKPGTYLYQSGTQPQVQVQMGLYGAVSANAVEANASNGTRAEAYAGVAYDNQATLLYSEIDPALHLAVDNGTYGTTGGPTSTFNYQPKYFLINGQPYPGNALIAPAGAPGTTLLRLLNAGLTTHVPMVQGIHWNVVAEDGKPYAFAARQYTALLPAAKTMDVVLTAAPDIGGGTRYPVLDRRLNLSNSGQAYGGMLAFLSYGVQGVSGAAGLDGNQAPTPMPDSYAGVKDVTLSVSAAEGLLLNDSDPDTLPMPLKAVAETGTTTKGGSYQLSSNGAFSYTPATGFVGDDSFNYSVTDGKALSAATVTVTVSRPDVPANLVLLDDFNRADAGSLGSSSSANGSWSQQVGTTTSAPDVGITGLAATSNTVALGGLALLNQVFTASQAAGFSASSLSESALVLKASGGSPNSPANFIRVRCEAGVNNGPELVIATIMGGSNVSVAARQAAFATSLCAGGGTLVAAVNAKGLVTAFIGGNYVGGVQLPQAAAWTGPGKLGIQLQSPGASVDNFSGASF